MGLQDASGQEVMRGALDVTETTWWIRPAPTVTHASPWTGTGRGRNGWRGFPPVLCWSHPLRTGFKDYEKKKKKKRKEKERKKKKLEEAIHPHKGVCAPPRRALPQEEQDSTPTLGTRSTFQKGIKVKPGQIPGEARCAGSRTSRRRDQD